MSHALPFRQSFTEEYSLDTTPVIASDGKKVPITIFFPAKLDGTKATGKFPVLVWAHGVFPEDEDDESDFVDKARWLKSIVKTGYVIICVDYRGTGGHGVTHFKNESILQDELKDMKAVSDWAKTQPFIFANKVLAVGHYRGGNIALYLANNYPNDFSGFASLYGTPNIGHSMQFWPDTPSISDVYARIVDDFGGEPEDTEEYITQSPAYNIDDITKPIFMINAEHDDMVNYKAPYQFYLDMKEADKDVELHLYRGQNQGALFNIDDREDKPFVSAPWLDFISWIKEKI